MRYREHAPPPALAAHVVCTWEQSMEEDTAHRVLPDGCVDLVWVNEEAPVIAGPATGAVFVSLPAGCHVVGVRLRPGAVPATLGVGADELRDREVALGDVWARVTDLGAAIAARAPAERRFAIEAALVARWAGADRVDARLGAAMAWLARHPDAPVQPLAASLRLGARQLQRCFVSAVGYPPKMFQRIVRLQRLLALARRPGCADLAALAVAGGYADQPHMTRELRALTGQTPAALLGSRGSTLAMSDLFKTEVAARR